MNEGKSTTDEFDRELALAYIEKAEREGRTADEGYWDYLETLGIPRPEETDAFLKRIREENDQINKRLRGYLDEIRQLARAAQKKYAGV
ncbi:hypothetical protein L0337_43545 [candidate division KSB1 bacterium]|nr:hypothetical protein [candidate division KSB1 bacterium]